MKQIAIAIHSFGSTLHLPRAGQLPLALKRSFVILVFLALFVAEILRVYLVMPFPGSQVKDTVGLAHWISTHIMWIRVIALSIAGIATLNVFRQGKIGERIILPLVILAYIVSFFFFNYRFDAESIFHQPTNRSFIPVSQSPEKNKLVIGIVVNGEAKAYPIQLIGYHHQVVDTVGNQPVIVTYCTVCRTGRVYSAIINDRQEKFRLVGMDHFNAVFEDEGTQSWWQQATGEAIAGPMKGSRLKEIPSSQVSVAAWERQFPGSVIMAPDPDYEERYFGLDNYDRGTMYSPLVRRDYQPWQPKSWIIGVKNESAAVAYDWNELVKKRLIQDSLQGLPIALMMETDTTSFHVYDRRLNGQVLQFNPGSTANTFTDINTNSTWNMDGLCTSGQLSGKQLSSVQGYNEFWHAWQSFQPNATRYSPGKK